MGSVLRHNLRERLRGLVWWALGLVGLVAMMSAVYPTVRDNEDMSRLIEEYPDALKAFIAFGGAVDYTTGAGYLGSELFSFMIPLLFIVAAIGYGAGGIAGEEERGTLELLLAQPVSRRRVAIAKLAGLAIELAALAGVLWVALWLGGAVTDMGVGPGELAAACTAGAVLALVYGSLAFMIGGATGHKTPAIGIAAALAVLAYLVNALAALVDLFSRIQTTSPFYHYMAGDLLRKGFSFTHLAVLAVAAVATATIGVVLFERRDLGQ